MVLLPPAEPSEWLTDELLFGASDSAPPSGPAFALGPATYCLPQPHGGRAVHTVTVYVRAASAGSNAGQPPGLALASALRRRRVHHLNGRCRRHEKFRLQLDRATGPEDR